MIHWKHLMVGCIAAVLAVLAPLSGAQVSGEPQKWHAVTLTFDGPQTSETSEPNPFLFYRLDVTFRHEGSGKTYVIPGYHAADGNAGETSADSGNKWRVHFSPDETGLWKYAVSFRKGENIAVSDDAKTGESAGFFDGDSGSFQIVPSNKKAPDFRAKGCLRYVGRRYLQFAETAEYFLKAGPDAPETLLGYEDFDGTYTLGVLLKKYQPHLADWQSGDPVWKGGKGKGLIGALNYLSRKGLNTLSFLTYNSGGDGSNVWPFIKHDLKTRYDCSKLDQWRIVFDHAQAKGLHLSFKTQETEIDNEVPQSLDGGDLGVERKLYYREMIARFGHYPALTWNLGEENTQTPVQQRAMAAYLASHDPYKHNIVIHTYTHEQDKVYRPLLGGQSELTGASLQNDWEQTHSLTLRWIQESEQSGRAWVVANDEQNGVGTGVPPDIGYSGFDPAEIGYGPDDIRKSTLWGNLMAGGAGVEYYFGYDLSQNDLYCEDWRSRDKTWDYARIALDFFTTQEIPIERMHCDDLLTTDTDDFCFFRDGEIYLIYRKHGGSTSLDFSKGRFEIGWFNPRTGEGMKSLLQPETIDGPAKITLTAPDNEDWLLIIRSRDGGRIIHPVTQG